AMARNTVGVSFGRRSGGRFAAGTDGGYAAFARGIREDKRIATEVVAMWLDDREHRGHRERRVEGVAAAAQDVETSLGCERVLGGNHAVGAKHRAADRGDAVSVRHRHGPSAFARAALSLVAVRSAFAMRVIEPPFSTTGRA